MKKEVLRGQRLVSAKIQLRELQSETTTDLLAGIGLESLKLDSKFTVVRAEFLHAPSSL